ncbi:hypothetical protein NPIL_184071 [Nephila pilipes]|uniref:Uncharacterized protein n=1 Tax=Nephila pilipes TaxID=299642 RepID=A0A8X6PWV6_NEPPI|nr:hypothetical protein NPIL_184071 [Nephila pilipes]
MHWQGLGLIFRDPAIFDLWNMVSHPEPRTWASEMRMRVKERCNKQNIFFYGIGGLHGPGPGPNNPSGQSGLRLFLTQQAPHKSEEGL